MAAEPLSPAQSLTQPFLRLSLVGSRLESARAKPAALAPQLDWLEVGRRAEAERLEPLLYRILKDSPRLPAEVLAGWRRAYEQTARRNLVALFELARVVRRLRERGIEALILKGAALMPTVDADLSLRPLRDLDLLVRRAVLEPALECLQALDYERLGIEPQPGLAAYESQARLHKRGPVQIIIELHWGAPAPAEVLNRLASLQPTEAGRRVFDGLGGAGRPAGPRLWLDLTSMPGWRQRLRFAWGNLLPSAHYMRMRYNIRYGLQTPLYYPYRWLLGIRSALWKV